MDSPHQTSHSLGQLPFADRDEAGRELALRLLRYRGTLNLVVLGLPRGGVPVAAKVADALDAPLDVFVVRHSRQRGRGGDTGGTRGARTARARLP